MYLQSRLRRRLLRLAQTLTLTLIGVVLFAPKLDVRTLTDTMSMVM